MDEPSTTGSFRGLMSFLPKVLVRLFISPAAVDMTNRWIGDKLHKITHVLDLTIPPTSYKLVYKTKQMSY